MGKEWIETTAGNHMVTNELESHASRFSAEGERRLFSTYKKICGYVVYTLQKQGVHNWESLYEDIVQELYLSILNGKRHWDPSRPPLPYLRKSVKYVIADHIKNAVKAKNIPSEFEQKESETPAEDLATEEAKRLKREREMEIISQYPELI